jgi:carbon-monoxide dehydrogenase medium subunit
VLSDALAELSEDVVAYAGGTELLLAMKAGLLRPDTLVDVKRIEPLRRLESDTDPIVIGGAVTHHEALTDPGIRAHLPILAKVLGRVGNPRVRSVGTLGGNLCFAEPKSDVATILIALGARVTLVSAGGERQLPVEDFVVGPYTTMRADDELLTEMTIPLDRTRAVYEKFQTMERPTVGVAASLDPKDRVRVVVGAAAGAPHLFTADAIDLIDPARAAADVDIIPDMTGSIRYKRHITRLYVERVLRALEST